MPPENLGARTVEEVTVDIQNLDSAGSEPFSTFTDNSAIDVVDNITVVGQEEDVQLFIPDHMNDQFHVVDVADGTDTANDTDVGEVKVRIEGRR